ncbi:hypothetical protein Gbth_014_018 [Gluconobacter thailandicus F149-1 = NBRC 100600]|nr:hypothetical protein AD946_01960 [Gluconobacter thailandicus]GAN92662.1 hypothetical protein Gbth_014_018 [Gluconobacter thailandicus F149-1 = NBRC 100600]GBR58654.1 hypothetical protein AA100600_0912 [Gluconobacter thailandicus F149-1 = NBRC 100600]GEL88481.1 hypothetical protein GTH01_28390 [Gluconobacter thailandicus F149-1 = NBRC 100600]
MTGLAVGSLLGPMMPDLATTGIPAVAFWSSYVEAFQSSELLFFLTGAIGGLAYAILARPEKRASSLLDRTS